MIGKSSSTAYDDLLQTEDQEFQTIDNDFLDRSEDGFFALQYEEIDQFCESSNSNKEKYGIKELQDIYDTYGPSSPQFYEQVKKLLIYLLHRYLNRYDSDCLHDCYIRLLESFSYWDPERCNIVSWVHMVVRNRISSFCHTIKKKQRENGVLDESIADTNESEDIHERDKVSVFLKSFRRVKVLGAEGLSEVVAMLQDHPIYQGSLWEVWSCQKKEKKVRRRSVISMQWS